MATRCPIPRVLERAASGPPDRDRSAVRWRARTRAANESAGSPVTSAERHLVIAVVPGSRSRSVVASTSRGVRRIGVGPPAMSLEVDPCPCQRAARVGARLNFRQHIWSIPLRLDAHGWNERFRPSERYIFGTFRGRRLVVEGGTRRMRHGRRVGSRSYDGEGAVDAVCRVQQLRDGQ